MGYLDRARQIINKAHKLSIESLDKGIVNHKLGFTVIYTFEGEILVNDEKMNHSEAIAKIMHLLGY